MAETSSLSAELVELEDKINLQRAIVASMSEYTLGGDPEEDEQDMAVAQAQLGALLARRTYLRDHGQAPSVESASGVKTEAGPSDFSSPRLPQSRTPIKSEMASWRQHQAEIEPSPGPSRPANGLPSRTTAAMPEYSGVSSRLQKSEPGSSPNGFSTNSPDSQAQIPAIASGLTRDVKAAVEPLKGFKGSRDETKALMDEIDAEVRDLISFAKAQIYSLGATMTHPEIDKLERNYERWMSTIKNRLLAPQFGSVYRGSPGGQWVGSPASSAPKPGQFSRSIPTPDTGSDSSRGHSGQSTADSRKRSFGTHIKDEPTHDYSQAKSMRMSTPAGAGLSDPFASPSAGRVMEHDVIDLTGDDDEAYQQINREQEARSARLKRERDQNEAFARSLAGFPARQASDYDQNPLTGRPMPAPTSLPIHSNPASQMPGTYHSSGDDDSDEEFRLMNGLPPTPQQPFGQPGSSSQARAGTFEWGSYRPTAPAPPVYGPIPSLSEIARRANNIDYVNLMGADGNPLTGRLYDFLDPAQTAAKEEDEIRNLFKSSRPDLDIPENELDPTPESLKFPLFAHQRLALKWMRSMEEDKLKKGGILADDMGLGKTITTLSLMVSRPSQQVDLKTNLIIGPVALVRQWEAEIAAKLKAGHTMSVYLLHGQRRLPFAKLRSFDVVLTTYGTIAAEYKRMEKYRSTFRKSEGEYAEDTVLQKQCPLLHSKSRFWRIILDEAQCIKNHTTQAAKAVHSLQGEYRWCLSGTPMMNGAHELFSLFQFLRIAPYNKQKAFTKAFGILKPGGRAPRFQREALRNNALKQLQAVLQAVMLRREKTSLINGKPILDLPPKMEEIVHVCFSVDEQSFYSDLETSSQNQFNKYMRAGTLRKNYSNILVLLLRLRQACCHPNLNFDVEYAPDSVVSTEQMMELARKFGQEVIERLKAAESFECPICYDAVQDPTILFPCGHDMCGECLSRLTSDSEQNNIQAGQAGDGNASALCPQCRVKIDSRKVVNYATFKRVHMPERAAAEGLLTEDGDGSDDDSDDSEDDNKWAQNWGTESDGSESGDDFDDEEADEKGNLKDFVVADDASDDEAVSDGSDDLEPVKAESSSLKLENRVVKDSEDEDFDDDLEPRIAAPSPFKGKGKAEDLDDDFAIQQVAAAKKSKGKGKAVEDSEDDFEMPPVVAVKRSKGKATSRQAKAGLNGKFKGSSGGRRSKNKGKGKSKDKVRPHELQELRKEASRNKASRKKYMDYLYNNWISSAKVSRCTQLLSEIQEKGEKTLVFSVWTGLLDLLEVAIMRDIGLPVCRYDGSMSRDHRDKAVLSFQNNPRSTIMLVSLRAGNAGLNLTAASQVIIMDPFWNPFIEMQAVDRAHRMGQMRTVSVHRILVKGTVEDRISALQEQKRSLVNAALNEGDHKEIARLSTKELEYLFGIGRRR